ERSAAYLRSTGTHKSCASPTRYQWVSAYYPHTVVSRCALTTRMGFTKLRVSDSLTPLTTA
ncbi:hypothetical protein, partial [uncultured Duncaniella sp.]|uniref:hypothetical protein n=1 Tax=uncultured Duncaniella sp. TaxID=2768039 RepID=UPI002670BC18